LGYTDVRNTSREKITSDNAWEFAEYFANLGEKKIALLTARQAMDSDNWNVRYFAVAALGRVDSVDAIPTAMECLGVELAYIVAGQKHTGFDERIYRRLCEILAKRTKKDFGLDPCAWANWWDTARVPHFAPALTVDADAAKKAFAEYQKRAKDGR